VDGADADDRERVAVGRKNYNARPRYEGKGTAIHGDWTRIGPKPVAFPAEDLDAPPVPELADREVEVKLGDGAMASAAERLGRSPTFASARDEQTLASLLREQVTAAAAAGRTSSTFRVPDGEIGAKDGMFFLSSEDGSVGWRCALRENGTIKVLQCFSRQPAPIAKLADAA
jgi:hypothetical protein